VLARRRRRLERGQPAVIQPGELWGEPEHGQPDLVVTGNDADLAHALIGSRPGVLVAFTPSEESDIARAIGLRAGVARQGFALPMDGLQLDDGTLAVNMVILGSPPDRLTWRHRSSEIKLRLDEREIGLSIKRSTSVVIANGQWLRGLDVVPRGHPGDGKVDVHLYRIGPRERTGMRTRLPTGAHLPHQSIVTRTAVVAEVRSKRELTLEIDGQVSPSKVSELRVTLTPARYRLLI
jgi:hypothetical protein